MEATMIVLAFVLACNTVVNALLLVAAVRLEARASEMEELLRKNREAGAAVLRCADKKAKEMERTLLRIDLNTNR